MYIGCQWTAEVFDIDVAGTTAANVGLRLWQAAEKVPARLSGQRGELYWFWNEGNLTFDNTNPVLVDKIQLNVTQLIVIAFSQKIYNR